MMSHLINNKLRYWVATAILMVIVGCDQMPADSSANSNKLVVRSQQKAEGIELTVEAAPAELRLSDELLLTVTIRKPASMRIEFPRLEESLAEFTIRDFQNPLPKLDGQFEIIRQVYRLEPTRIGQLTIIPPAVTYASSGVADSAAASTDLWEIIEVDPLQIEVTTELASPARNLDQLRPENQPVELPAHQRNLVSWVILLAVAVCLLAVLTARMVTKRAKLVPQLSPRDLARQELRKLVEDNWSKLDPKRYYVELTGIVRRFIEGAMGIRAPEQTTEEFLIALARKRVFTDEVQMRLREFLESADLVKFAGLKPSDREIAHSLDSAGRFIESELDTLEPLSK